MSLLQANAHSPERGAAAPTDVGQTRPTTFPFAEAKYFLPLLVVPLLWEIGVRSAIINANLFPPPSAIGAALIDLARAGMLWRDASASILRVLVGFSIATLAGVGLGLLLGRLSLLARYVLPLIEVIRPISVIAWIPIAILWFGLGDRPAWFLIALGAFFPIFTNTYDGARSLADVYVRVARCFGAPRALFIRQVLLPATVPHILTGMRIGLGTGWTCVIAAELVSATSGLGYMIQLARTTIETEKVLAGMLVIGLIGFAMNSLMLLIERRLTVRQGLPD
ncbi:ABC transporter permease [Bradyrhizobium sp. Pear77]|uniref:ABC transporter permease n=1 Tax=Bradyrhizobium TaxID=374 RepID=UPI001E2846C1|nr:MULTISPECIES: ABC transporter permease [Bradyrhizobium]MCC8953583.1 ABC transporter permease [Bradyrhizobium altum]MCC8962904.1 ABC transporter permease [Bradyrhizobium oropedii]